MVIVSFRVQCEPLEYKHTERQASSIQAAAFRSFDACHDAWEWIRDQFWSVTMHSNLTMLLDAPLDARCGYVFKQWLAFKMRVRYEIYIVNFLIQAIFDIWSVKFF